MTDGGAYVKPTASISNQVKEMETHCITEYKDNKKQLPCWCLEEAKQNYIYSVLPTAEVWMWHTQAFKSGSEPNLSNGWKVNMFLSSILWHLISNTLITQWDTRKNRVKVVAFNGLSYAALI